MVLGDEGVDLQEVCGLGEARINGDGVAVAAQKDGAGVAVHTKCRRKFSLGVLPVVIRELRVRLGVEFDDHVAFGEIVCNGSVAVGLLVHPFTPSAPVGVHIDEDFLLCLLRFDEGGIEGFPGQRGFSGVAVGYAGKGECCKKYNGCARLHGVPEFGGQNVIVNVTA